MTHTHAVYCLIAFKQTDKKKYIIKYLVPETKNKSPTLLLNWKFTLLQAYTEPSGRDKVNVRYGKQRNSNTETESPKRRREKKMHR